MIPSVLTHQLRRGVEDFLRTTFPVSTPHFREVLDTLLNEDGGVFKGPYLSIQLPFRQGKPGPGAHFFPQVPLGFTPHVHQENAFRRLRGPNPRSSIIATGTGSGKTESFLLPILDHCLTQRGEPGVKAILIYPMNALATDQALRLARLIHANESLRGHVTAGLYVGQDNHKDGQRKTMDPNGVITDRETMRLSPPDILLTNYKMLDYLLIRPRDQKLWSENTTESLRYLVVDELHTFDGAQGTDLACLIRRLKDRLGTPAGHLCCVGTSATLGSDQERGGLVDYATQIFGEPLDPDAVIGEDRHTAGEFLEESLIRRIEIVPPDQESALDPDTYDGVESYLRAQHGLWLDADVPPQAFDQSEWRIALGDSLKEHLLFQNLLKVLAGATRSYADILARLENVTPDLRKGSPRYRALLLDSLLALISAARIRREDDQDKTAPFLNVRCQLWLRELSRLVASVGPEPRLTFSADLTEESRGHHLPAVHCRTCGAMGWTGLRRKLEYKVSGELRAYYEAFFRDEPTVTFFFPEQGTPPHEMDGDYWHLCECLYLSPDGTEKCGGCGKAPGPRVFRPASRTTNGKGRSVSVHNCPYCGARNGLTLLGSRAASLTSVLVSQLFASRYNDDKKLLTFSDSVQDAAHRAGFFGARTFGFTLRMALIQFLAEEGDGLPLDVLSNRFRAWWLARLTPEAFVATFLAPNLTWMHDYEKMLEEGHLAPDSPLPDRVCRRLDWEITSEFGFRARVGRTLEKTGSAMVRPATDRFNDAVARVGEVLRNEIGPLRQVDDPSLRRFLLGILTRLKNQGGILHPVLDAYIDTLGNTYLINRIRWMQKFGPNTPAPSFLATRRGRRFDALLSPKRATWYQRWAEKCLAHVDPMILNATPDVYEVTLRGLVQAGLLEERLAGEVRVWGIRPQGLVLTTAVTAFTCDRCDHASAQADTDRSTWTGAPCLRASCEGTCRPQPPRVDYYGLLYRQGDIVRIFAAEHTGLLKREEREKLETRFKADTSKAGAGDPNLLSCTPTLEMGIDIGDLSSLILCSVPPTQANYLQRIGRAGRRDGNALNVTVANARAHDLFFFAEPEEMISGAVSTPGVFLDASAVLERQLTAYCFDRWVASGVSDDELPRQLGQVLGNVQKQNLTGFPYNLLTFVDTHRTMLFDRFVQLFDGRLTDDSRKHLTTYMEGDSDQKDSLPWRILDRLQGVNKERDSLRKKMRVLQDKIKRKEAEPAQDKNHARDMAELKHEKSALRKLASDISDRDTFNFFTDEGLLPNYAFPEAGVMLRSIIYRKKETPDEGPRYLTRTYDYERPAASAISELAPANRFFAGGRRVTVDQVDLSVSEVENWRFCNNCSHSEMIDVGDDKTVCIRCGSPFWADAGQKRPMVRMRQVFATTADPKSRIGDDSDDRDPQFYNRQMLVDFDEKHVREAWRLDAEDLPFGFEFVDRVDFREINFGLKVEEAERVTIAGEDLPRKGFRICRQCGKVQMKRDKAVHALSCTARNQQSDKNFIDCVYLYREFTSEAVRILLPVTTFSGSDRKFHSFIAALQLGLKKYFSGRIDHLRTTAYEEPVADSSYRKRYLVLYDTVPGGTGYLKELMRSPEHLFKVLQNSLDALRSCSCSQNPAQDGCYRCLLAYNRSFELKEISRREAIALLSEILRRKDKLVEVEGLRKVPVNALFDSELEARFVEALRRARTEERPVTLTNEVLPNGKAGYFLKVGGRAWYVEPQAPLGGAEGVKIPSKSDFLFTPAREQHAKKGVAVFTDGYAFHRNRLDLDTAQRMAILRSSRYRCWSLTWRDVENRFRPQSAWYQNYLDASYAAQGGLLPTLLDKFGVQKFRRFNTTDSFEWLMSYLENPDDDAWRTYAYAHASVRMDPAQAFDAWRTRLEQTLTEDMYEDALDLALPCLYGRGQSHDTVECLVCAEHSGISNRDPLKMRVVCHLDDRAERREKVDFEGEWNGFLRVLNLFQFLPRTWFVTATGVAGGAYAHLPVSESVATVPEEVYVSDDWQAVLTDCVQDARSLVSRLAAAGWSAPEVGYELQDASGRIIASAELAWSALRLALVRDDEVEFRPAFEKVGWRAVRLTDAVADDQFEHSLEPA